MRTSTIFRSRWWALLWSAGVLWLAVDIASPEQPARTANTNVVTDATGAEVSDEELQKFADALNSD